MRKKAGAPLHLQVLENVEEAVIAIDAQGRIALLNPAAEAFTGHSRKHCLGRSCRELFDRQPNLLYLIRCALEDGRSIADHENIELQRPLAAPLPVSASVAPIYTPAGAIDGAVLIMRDLTRIRDLEETVRRADRLSMLGTLAAGLAHEIKNPLGGIKGAAQLLDLEIPPHSPLKEYTAVMIREAERVNGIIEELMDLSRPRPLQFGPVNLAKILDDIVLLQRQAQGDRQIGFLLNLDPSIPPFPGDAQLLSRLFLNLVKNAAEAVEPRGTVEIVSKMAGDFHLNQPGDRPVPRITIEVRDNGRGITAEEMDQIFTPFYTTKIRGSGLGLAICQKIVLEHQGLLKIASTPGAGTVISVSLPLRRINAGLC